MDTVPERRPTETFDLVTRVVALRRRGVPRVTLLAAQDQAWTSLHHEPHRDVRRTLTWVLRAIDGGEHDDVRLDAALRVAARDLGRPPSSGYAR
ncbi:hypothetical protein [Actinomycetospora cinnamomea]|uniref:Uncharacterized protein n=1 Tax=Actinomycetospora cinnamomea TaxID=663609 RepID=A0A2U1F2A8_9PSEU|nr:hypothetical protein [Actinomycetospora cinnamomea]PVZ06302.1 hypothetical protein C8D89_11340 [Actinomycetospora cinnamomea]